MELDIEQIMQEIREEIAAQPPVPEPPAFAPESAADALGFLQAHTALRPYRALSGNPGKVFVQRVIRRMLRFLIVPLAEEQSEINAAAVRVLSELVQREEHP